MMVWGTWCWLAMLAIGAEPGQPAVPPPPAAASQPDREPVRRAGEHHRAWSRMSPEERQIVREIAEALREMPEEKRAEMLRALNRYRQWLESLPPEQQERGLRMPPGKRLAYMRRVAKPPPPGGGV